ncbi:MAG: TTC39/IML2 family protein [Balneolia bacterium]|nr:TTC39/IML2 family protein [Balneolia bacterium]
MILSRLPALILLIILSLSMMAFSSTDSSHSEAESDPVDALLTEAIQAFYDSDWRTARQLIEQLKSDSPNNPTVYFYDSMLPFWAYFFAGSQNSDAKEFLDRSERAIDVSERHLRTARNDTSTVLLLSGLHGYRGLVAASEREYRTAVRSAMTGFTYTRQLLSMDSDDPNAMMGRGVFNYMMGTIPSEVRWVTSFAGFSGDRETGFEQLETAARAGTHVSVDALMILTYLYLRDEEFENALRTSEKLIEKHPENVIFHFYKAQSLEKLGRTAEARSSYRTVVDLNNSNLLYLRDQAGERLEILTAEG